MSVTMAAAKLACCYHTSGSKYTLLLSGSAFVLF